MSELANQIESASDDTRRSFQQLLKQQERSIQRALPRSMSADRFLRVVLTEVNRTPKLRTCTEESILGGLMLSAQLGLEIGSVLGHAFLVPRKNRRQGVVEATFQIGYRGYQELAARNGWVLTAGSVRAGDDFDWQDGTDPFLLHRAKQWEGHPEFYWAVGRKEGYSPVFQVWPRGRVESHRNRHVPYWADGTPWVTDPDAMAQKTVIAAVARGVQLQPEAQHAVALDGQAIRDVKVNIDEHVPELVVETTASAADTARQPEPEPDLAPTEPDPPPDPASEPEPALSRYAGIPVPRLREMCEARGLSSKGQRQTLEARLEEDDARPSVERPTAQDEDDEADQ